MMDTLEFKISSSYLIVFIVIYIDSQLQSTLCSKCVDFNIPIVNYLFLNSKISSTLSYGETHLNVTTIHQFHLRSKMRLAQNRSQVRKWGNTTCIDTIKFCGHNKLTNTMCLNSYRLMPIAAGISLDAYHFETTNLSSLRFIEIPFFPPW